MRKIVLLLFTALSTTIAMAEDVIQVLPVTTKAGQISVQQTNALSVQLVNTRVIKALQFDMFLPDGMTINTSRVTLSKSRMPNEYDEWDDRTIFQHSVSITDKGNGHYFITCYAEDIDYSIIGNSGEIFKLYFMTSADMKPGVYPIRIEGTILGVSGSEGIYPENSVSFVTIKNSEGNTPANALLDMGNYFVPSFVESQLPTKNVIINGTCKNLVLTDGADFSAPCNFNATSASYSRSMSTTWGTICLPFAVASDENAEYYEITGIDDNVLTLTMYDILPAGTPALVKKLTGSDIAPQNTSVSVSNEVNNTNGTVINMYGSYTNDTRIEDTNSYYIYNNKFYQCNEYFFCDAFRAYFTLGGAYARVLNIDDYVSDVDSMTNQDVCVEAIYDINGVKRSDIGKGINIVKLSNGKTQNIIIK